jgi:hypothetical protein
LMTHEPLYSWNYWEQHYQRTIPFEPFLFNRIELNLLSYALCPGVVYILFAPLAIQPS